MNQRERPPAVEEEEDLYPTTDGEPMADSDANALRLIDTRSALRAAFRRRRTGYVTSDVFVYPVKGDPGTRNAPDILVAPGSPPGTRRSFKCWREPGGVEFAGEFLSIGEKLEAPEVLERIEFYRRYLATRELFVYEPLGEEFADGFRFLFLRLGEDGEYHPVPPGAGGWYACQTLGLEIRPKDEWIEVREPGTGKLYLPAEVRAEREEKRARQEAKRAASAERRVRELEAELARLRKGPPTP